MKKEINFFIPVVLALAVCFCLGMSGAPQQASTTEDELTKTAVDEAISDIEAAYDSRNVSEMMDVLDKNFEDWLGFKSAIENHFLSVKELQIHFVVDSFLTEADKVSVSLHWFKKTINNSGAFSKTEGRSQFAFHNTPGGLKLLYIRGDNPFF